MILGTWLSGLWLMIGRSRVQPLNRRVIAGETLNLTPHTTQPLPAVWSQAQFENGSVATGKASRVKPVPAAQWI